MTQETTKNFRTGRKSSIGTTAVVLGGSTGITLSRGVYVKAAAGNSGTVYVGKVSVTANAADGTDGYQLAAGDEIFIEAQDTTDLYVVGSGAGQSVFWLAY